MTTSDPSISWSCDRCDRQARLDVGKQPHGWVQLVVRRRAVIMPNREYDLCQPCLYDLDRFLRTQIERPEAG